MTIDEAIDIAWGADKFHGVPRPTIQQALEQIEEQLASCGFNWLTGQEAKRVLSEALSTIPVQEKPMARTTLTVNVEYNDEVTDPESLASAADHLMEAILSTPGITDDYANPRFGEFFVAPAGRTSEKAQPTVIVEVAGGLVQEVYSDNPLRLVILDWDAEDCEPNADDGVYEAGGENVAVAEMPVTSIDRIVGTNTEKALKAAGIDVNVGQASSDQNQHRRWVLYSLNTDELLGTKVYSEYDEAVEDAAQVERHSRVVTRDR